MSTHLPVDPADPNRGGLPIDDPAPLALVLGIPIPARHGKWTVVDDDPLSPVNHSPEFVRLKLRERGLGAFISESVLVGYEGPPTVTIPAETAARLQTLGAIQTLKAMLAPPAPRSTELWPGQHEHHRQYDIMVAEHATTGIYRDPVTGRPFPPGGAMLRDPNRKQRRRLKAWRASGKVRR